MEKDIRTKFNRDIHECVYETDCDRLRMCALNALFCSHVWGGPLQHQPTQSTHTKTNGTVTLSGSLWIFSTQSSLYLNIKVAMTAAVPLAGKLLTTSQSMVL